MKKLVVARSEMKRVAEEHKARGEEVRLHESGKLAAGRIILVLRGKHILIIR